MNWREVLKDYFSFSHKERVGIVIILLVISLAIFLPLFFSHRNVLGFQPPDSTWIAAIDELERRSAENKAQEGSKDENPGYYQYDHRSDNHRPSKPGSLFYFDPNTLSAESWQKLGLPGKTIHTIQNYLAKGGRFKKPEDLARIYSLRSDEYHRIAPYIRIAQKNDENKTGTVTENDRAISQEGKNKSSYGPIDINMADTTAFILLPGIGSKLASRIVNFRDKLGGFHTIDQVSETFGLPDSTFQKIRSYLKLETKSIKKININTATLDEMKIHPYFRYNIANAIVVYRNEHGPFASIEDLKKLMLITDEVLKKISPYVTL